MEADALAELARALELTLNPIPSPSDRRVQERGFLASLVNEIRPKPGWGFAVIPRATYDSLRPALAPRTGARVTIDGGLTSIPAG